MKKYKHKQTGTIVSAKEGDYGYHITFLGDQYIPRDIVENSNDWQEIVEKEWEIKSFINHLGVIERVGEGDLKSLGIYNWLNANFVIHSVKRLSDGEVFTVGDVCEFGKITKIFITKEGYCMTGTSICNYSSNITLLKKVKQPLFVTEDGKNIYTKQDVYFVDSNNFEYGCRLSWDEEEHFTSTSLNPRFKYFSTKEAAKNWIIENKPCLSFNDFKNHMQRDSVGKLVIIREEEIKNLIKKLNNSLT